MRLTVPIRQIVNNQTLEALKRSISKSIAEAAPHIKAAKENQIKILSQKFSDFNNWYMKITGLDKVNLAQEKVTALQAQLLEIQEKRRNVGKQLSEIREKSMELQDEIHKVKRQDDLERFLDLMKKETEILKLERSITKTFQDYDQTERELFTAFSDSIRDSHEKQRAQMEYTKYFSLVLSIAGSFLAFIYSTLRKEQLKKIIDDRLQMVNVNNDSHFVGQLLNSNKQIMQEISSTRQSFSEFSRLMDERKGAFETGTQHNELLNFYTENSSYIKVTGVILGLWLVGKILFG